MESLPYELIVSILKLLKPFKQLNMVFSCKLISILRRFLRMQYYDLHMMTQLFDEKTIDSINENKVVNSLQVLFKFNYLNPE